MKNLFKNLTAMLAMVSILFIVSCGDDEEPASAAPTISVTATPTEVAPGEDVTFTTTINSEAGFDRYIIWLSVDGGQSFSTVQEFGADDIDGVETGATSVTHSTISKITNNNIGLVLTFEFEVVDVDNKTATDQVEITIASPPAKVQTAVLLYAPTTNEDSKTFYSIADDSTYSVNDVEATADLSASIDLGYFFVTEANLASPSDYSTAFTGAYDISDWSTRNSTGLVLTTLTSVTEITSVSQVEEVLTGIDFGSAATTIEGLTAGDIFAFSTAGSLQGLMRVVKVEPGFESNDYIELEFILASAE